MQRLQLLAKMPGSMGRCIICLLAMFVIPTFANAAPAKGLGMWVWSKSSFSTEEARQQLISFCVDHRINHLDIHIEISSDKEKMVLPDADALKDLIRLAGQHNITTAALRGSPKMFFSENHDRTLQELEAIIALRESLPAESLFNGIKYDVEPYRTREWKARGSSLRTVMLDYLAFLCKARSVLHEKAPDFRLAVDMPFWWDKDEFVIEFDGSTKRFSEHVQDLTDFTVIMSYRRKVQKVLECVENERSYAKRINKVIFPSLETVELEQDRHISFWGSTSREFWDIVPQLQETIDEDPAMGGVMLHCYRSLAERFDDEPSDRARRRYRDLPKVPVE
jgi:hypothetical protein